VIADIGLLLSETLNDVDGRRRPYVVDISLVGDPEYQDPRPVEGLAFLIQLVG
jgi:hypothetical protein